MQAHTMRECLEKSTLNHPDFARWRANLASRDPVFHAHLSEQDLINVYQHRHEDGIRSIMQQIHTKQTQHPRLSQQEIEHSAQLAQQRLQEVQDQYMHWQRRTMVDTLGRELSLEECKMEFAAKDLPEHLARLQAAHDLASAQRAVLRAYPQRDALMDWMHQLDARDQSPGAKEAPTARHRQITIDQAIVEFESRNKDGYAHLQAHHNAQLQTISSLSPNQLMDHQAQCALAMRSQIKDGQFHAVDLNSPYVVHVERSVAPSPKLAPSNQVMQSLKINAQGPAGAQSTDSHSTEQIKQELNERHARPVKFERLLEQAEHIFSQFSGAVSSMARPYRDRQTMNRT